MKNFFTVPIFRRFVPIVLFGCVIALGVAEDHAVWSYGGSTGPEHWGDLDPAYALCKTGKAQSPIDIRETVGAKGTPLEFHYGESKVSLINNGHSIQQSLDPGSYVIYGEKRYNALQFHFHLGSEHTIAGKRYGMEMHIVHQSEEGESLVVGILLEEGRRNEFLAGFWDRLPAKVGVEHVDGGSKINLAEVLPETSGLYAYTGSLTTPPGTEGVSWFLFATPRSIDATQLAAFQKLHPDSFRPSQPLNGRKVTLWRRSSE